MSDARLLEIETRLRAIDRPAPEFARFRQPGGPLAKAHAWDAANPELSAEHRALVAERETLERIRRDRLAAERNLSSAEQRLSKLGLDRALQYAIEPEDTATLRYAREWLASDASWLILAGSLGSGKTVASAWVLRQAALLGNSVAFVRSSDLMQKQFDGDVRRLERADYLLIDDIGVEHASGFSQSLMGQLCDARHQLIDVRTIITTNLAREDLAKRVGDRVFDRWLESSVMKRSVSPSLRKGAA